MADKPDSQEICFIPDGDYRAFVKQRTGPKPGELVGVDGNVLGRHPGVQFFTVGQRRGLGLDGNTGRPMYVVNIDAQSNRVVLGRKENLLRSTLWASGVNFTSGVVPTGEIEVRAKIRYKAPESCATMVAHGDRAEIRFQEPQRAGDTRTGGGVLSWPGVDRRRDH